MLQAYANPDLGLDLRYAPGEAVHCAACDTWSQAGEREGGSPPCIAEHLRRFNCPACGAELLPRGPGLMCFQLDPQADFTGDRALRAAQPFPPLASFDIGGGAFSQLQPSQPAVCIPLATAVAPAAPGSTGAFGACNGSTTTVALSWIECFYYEVSLERRRHHPPQRHAQNQQLKAEPQQASAGAVSATTTAAVDHGYRGSGGGAFEDTLQLPTEFLAQAGAGAGAGAAGAARRPVRDPAECIAVGLATDRFALHGRQPGWTRNSLGWHGDDGQFFKGSGMGRGDFGPRFGDGDTVPTIDCTRTS